MSLKKLFKVGIFLGALIIPGIILQVQAKCEKELVYAQNKEIVYQSDKRYPQTVIYDIVTDFLSVTNNPKKQKVLVLGYDGFREDALTNMVGINQSAILHIANVEGLYHSYAGANGNQETSTAPGWLSILSGDWAYLHGVSNNEGRKPSDVPTFLSLAVNMGKPSIFVASWPAHFDITYFEDIHAGNNGVVYKQTLNDEETTIELKNLLNDTSESAKDVIFSTLEYTDHTGHSDGYGNDVISYVEASQQVDQIAYDIIQTIYQRETYQDEDWLIILTTDHGGYNLNHGGSSDEEKNTWFAINKLLASHID